MPPSFLLRAHSEGPQKTGRTTAGTRPHRQMFANSVSNVSKRWPIIPVCPPIMSFRCCGLRPSNPPAEPAWKLLMAAAMTGSNSLSGSCTFFAVYCGGATAHGCLLTARRSSPGNTWQPCRHWQPTAQHPSRHYPQSSPTLWQLAIPLE